MGLEVVQLLYGEGDVQVTMEVLRVTGGEGLSIDVDDWLLSVSN